jgi:hypothetical protein
VSAFEGQRTLLYAAISDISSSVKANDAKASAALVVHGLLFAGILSVVDKLDHAYRAATHLERILGVAFLGIALAAFLCSIWLLLSAVSPYRPKTLEEKISGSYPHVFFPVRGLFKGSTPHKTMRQRIESLDENTILDELIAEVLKLADILAYESDRAKWGYRALRVEVIAAAAFLVTAAFSVL